jgi:predicted esterase
VPQWTAELYEDALQAAGKTTEFYSHDGGHALDPSMLGSTGVKAWFDLHN